MTGRPALRPGEHGRVNLKRLANGKVRARVVVRDSDGRRREVVATAPSLDAANRKIQGLLKARHAPSSIGVTSSMTMTELCDYFLEQRRLQATSATPPSTHGRRRANKTSIRPQTVAAYAATIRCTIEPLLGELRLQDVTVGRLDSVLTELEHSGVSTQQMRSVLSQVFRLAVRHGALTTSPLTMVTPPPREQHEVEALEVAGVEILRHLVRPDVQGTPGRRQPNADLRDYVDVALGTGARISEVLALRWEHVDLDTTTPTALISGTLVEPRTGYVEKLHRQEYTKTGDVRRVILPTHVVDLLRTRRQGRKWTSEGDPVFASRTGNWLWPSNLRTRLREAIAGTDFVGTTPHTLRRTVGTVVAHELGLDAAREQLGHAHPGVTGRYYVARRKLAPDCCAVLSRFFATPTG